MFWLIAQLASPGFSIANTGSLRLVMSNSVTVNAPLCATIATEPDTYSTPVGRWYVNFNE